MTLVTGLAVYFVTWWICLFVVLPFGVKPPQNPAPGTVHSAPDRPRLGLKAAITTVLAGVVWLGIWGVIAAGWLDFREATF